MEKESRPEISEAKTSLDFQKAVETYKQNIEPEKLKETYWWNNGNPLMYKRKNPPLSSDLKPFFDGNGNEIDMETATQLSADGKVYYRWEPVHSGQTGLSILLHSERYEGVNVDELRKVMLAEAEKFEPGQEYTDTDMAERTREQRASGYLAVGYGKDKSGKVWLDEAYVNYEYRGRLRR